MTVIAQDDPAISTTLDEALTLHAATPGIGFSLSSYPGFPFIEYTTLQAKYERSANWYSGRALAEVMKAEGQEVEKYPIRLNPLPTTCMKHVFALFGDIPNDTRPLVVPRFLAPSSGDSEGKEETNKKLIHEAEESVNLVWWENFGRTLQIKNGILSQIFGGCVFGLKWVPEEALYREVPLKIETIDPRFFVGFPIPGDEFRLQECWIVKPIDWKTAEYYGVKIEQTQPAYWIEHWTSLTYEIKINDAPIKHPTDPEWKSSGPNEWGFVPFVYIPHVRVGGFYGQNVIDNLIGIVKEWNLRLADYGDAVSVDAHNIAVASDVQGQIRPLKPINGLTVLDIGNTASITGADQKPTLTELHKASASAAMGDLVQLLMGEYRRDSFVPAIADGEDEGSQRSSLTLTTRMWPLVFHTTMERIFWTGALDWFSKMILIILQKKGISGITEEHLKLRSKQLWYPILPKDREAVVNEAVNRSTTNLGSPQTLLENLGDVEDIDGEIDLIKEWVTFLEDSKSKQEVNGFSQNPVTPTGAKGTSKKGSANPSGANSTKGSSDD
jgi:hypothetical protein